MAGRWREEEEHVTDGEEGDRAELEMKKKDTGRDAGGRAMERTRAAGGKLAGGKEEAAAATGRGGRMPRRAAAAAARRDQFCFDTMLGK